VSPEDVRALQLFLARQGHSPGPVDSIRGPRTTTALQQYLQRSDPRVRIDGIWGPQTEAGYGRLRASGMITGGQSRTPQPTPTTAPRSRSGLTGSVGLGATNRAVEVMMVEELLNAAKAVARGTWPQLRADGICTGAEDDALVQVIKSFQREVLEWRQPDGVVDPGGRTYSKLTELAARSSGSLPPVADVPNGTSARTGYVFDEPLLRGVWYTAKGDEPSLVDVLVAFRQHYGIMQATPGELLAMTQALNSGRYPTLGQGRLQPGMKIRMPDPDDIAGKMARRLHFDGGVLQVLTPEQSVEFEVPAISGVLSHNTHHFEKPEIMVPPADYIFPEHTALENVGPIPQGEYFIELKPGVPPEKTGPGWGAFALRINPSSERLYAATQWAKTQDWLKNLIGTPSPYYNRGGFFLHQDDMKNGTAGCIGVLGNEEARSFHVWLKQYEGERGYGRINLTVDYRDFRMPDLPDIERPSER
jgi:hypothetical protein